jgi:hypothetical protein
MINLICCPSGRWAFVGQVPEVLSYVRKDGAPLTDADRRAIRQAGPGFAPVRALTWATREEAFAAASAAGVEVSS